MVVIEEGGARLREQQALGAMFRARKHVFVDLLKWDVPVIAGEYEVDEFDDQHATYVLVADADGHHLASARLLPTERPHILNSLFPCLVAGTVPSGPHVFEITRFCLDPRQHARDRREARNRLISALVRVALERRISTYTGVAELSWLQQILAFGWDCRPLGPPLQLECGLLGALAIDITPETPALLAQNGVWADRNALASELPQAA